MKHLTSVLETVKKPINTLAMGQQGVTGLETAIILIAFVVVASVFAFTVLSTGIFSSERGKETIYAGLREASSSIELKGQIIANGVSDKTLSNHCRGGLDLSDVTTTLDTADKKQGSGSADIQVGAADGTGLVAYEDLASTVDISSLDSIQLWIKSSVALDANDLQLTIDDSAGCGSNLENINLPALVAATWTKVTVGITNNNDMTAVKCVGLTAAVDKGAQTVNVDQVYARGQANSVVFNLTNALKGEAVDFIQPADSDSDGIADSDVDHKLLITYTDENQRVNDLYWTRAFLGTTDGDDLLEQNEKVEITINLVGLAKANPLVKNTVFTLEVRPNEGGVVLIRRTTPDKIDTVMNLN